MTKSFIKLKKPFLAHFPKFGSKKNVSRKFDSVTHFIGQNSEKN